MAKVKFNKLTLGHPLTREAIWDNLDQCATAISGNIVADQRQENRSLFTLALQRVRCGPDYLTENSAGVPFGFAIPFFNDTGIKDLSFFLPPLQEFFSSDLVAGLTTPDIILETLAVSFDNANQQYPIDLATGLPDSSLTFERDLTVEVQSGSFSAQATIPKSTLNISNDEIINRPNPTLSASIGAVIDPYAKLEITVRSPIETQRPLDATVKDQRRGIDNLVIHATFSAPIVQRDTLAHTVLPQNVPLTVGTARSSTNCNLSTPVAASLVKAGDRTAAATDGVQDAFEQLDREVRDKLRGGLTRWSELRPFSESLKEDQGYFCISVPLFNIAENNLTLSSAASSNTSAARTVDGYIRPSVLRSVNALMDRAVIPIVAPGTIHHVGVFWDKFVSTTPTFDFKMDLGVAIGCAPGSLTDSYTQVCQVAEKNVTYSSNTAFIQHFFAPIAYSTAGGAPALGEGYVTQGRPFFFGQEVDLTGGVRRHNVADASNPAAVEAAPATNGTEQFIEVRCNLYKYDTAAGAYKNIEEGITGAGATQATQLAGWSGVMVCLYGKMALVE